MISEYLTGNHDRPEKITELSDIIEHFFSESDNEMEFYNKLDKLTNEVTEEMITAVIGNLKHRDGSHSDIKWSKEDIENNIVRQYDVKNKLATYGKTYDNCKFWFAMNYVYAVHHNVNRTLNGYVDLAIDEMCNKNMCFDDMIREMYSDIQ